MGDTAAVAGAAVASTPVAGVVAAFESTVFAIAVAACVAMLGAIMHMLWPPILQ